MAPALPRLRLFTGSNTDVRVSIVDPHGFHLGDALPKLRGLADCTETYGCEFHRIEAVAQTKDLTLRVLDLKDPAAREAIRPATDAESLHLSAVAETY